MEHVVFFPAQDGTPAFRRVASLEDAVRLVEHLRNVEGVSEVSVHALTEVPLAFKAYYRVEVPTGEVPTVEVSGAHAAPEVVAQAPAAFGAFDAFEVPTIVPDVTAVPAVEPDAPAAEVVAIAEPVEVTEVLVQDLVPEQGDGALVASNGHQAERPHSLGFFAS